MGYNMSVTEKAKDFIVDKGWDSQFGARPLKRAIQKYIEDALAEEIIKSKIHEGDIIVIDHEAENTELKISITNPSTSQEITKQN
jgi:ATP-dependent Clp protease ATP-binding subunit ClpC